MSKLLLFPKLSPAPAPIHTIERIITISIGSERYAMTIQAKIERVSAPPMDKPLPDFLCDRKSELRKLVPTLRADADRTSGTTDGSAAESTTTRAKSVTLQSNTGKAPAPVATVGPQAPDVAPRAGKASKKATRSDKPATKRTPRPGGRARAARSKTEAGDSRLGPGTEEK